MAAKELMDQLGTAYKAAIEHEDFNTNETAIKKAIEALKIPDPEARFRKQFTAIAKRNLLVKNAEGGKDILMPTEEEIAEEVDRLMTNWRKNKKQ